MNEIKNSDKYEIILVDAPPILGLADSLLISEYVDGVILIVGLGAVDRALPKETINKIKSIGSNFYGIVTNQTINENKLKKMGYESYGAEYAGYAYASYGITDSDSSNSNINGEDTKDVDSKDSTTDNLSERNKLIFKKAIIFIKEKAKIVIDWLEK